MNKFIKNAIISAIILIISFCFKFNINAVNGATISNAECVIDVASLRVLSENNSNKKLPMASTTKILTAITVIENFNLDTVITVPKQAVGVEGSSIYLREGEKLTVKELLYGLMLRSGNDCAECLAITLCDNRSEFISLMNKTAKNYGAYNSNFVNPHGLHHDNHYTTAYDLAVISANAMKNPTFREIVATKRVSISNDGYDYQRVLINKNKMLNMVDGATGIKTGYTKKAGRCLVSSVKRNGFEVVSVVLNSPNMWERSTEIINNAFNNYNVTKIFDADKFNGEIRVDSKGNKYNFLVESDFYYPISNNELNNVILKINGESLSEYCKNPSKVGELQIFIQNKLIFSQNLFTIYSK